jgi:hypothetical protein
MLPAAEIARPDDPIAEFVIKRQPTRPRPPDVDARGGGRSYCIPDRVSGGRDDRSGLLRRDAGLTARSLTRPNRTDGGYVFESWRIGDRSARLFVSTRRVGFFLSVE